MRISVCSNPEEYKAFLISHPKCHFAQSPEWARVKSQWESKILLATDEGGAIRGAINVLIRRTPFLNYSIMLSSRAPVCDPHDAETIKALLDGAKQLAKTCNAYVLIMEPDVERGDAGFEKIVKDLGFEIKNSSKNFEGINPRFVYRLDIKGKTEEELIMSFQQKCRYNIRLAARRGVEVIAGGRDDIPEFYSCYVETAVRDKFVPRSIQYFYNMYDSMGPQHMRLYLARYDGKTIAGIIVIAYGKKCWYLYGGSSNLHRNLMPNYLLQWEAIKWALNNGCEVYDFRGVSGDLDEKNPLYGIYRFKKGFNGTLVELVGEVNYVFKPFVYFMAEKGFRCLRSIRSALFSLSRRGKDASNEKADN